MRFIAMITAATVLLAPHGGQAEGTPSRRDRLRDQVNMLDDRAAGQFSARIGLAAPRAIVPGTPEALALGQAPDSPYLETAREVARAHRVPPGLFLRLVQQESGWDARALSPKGAFGLAQVMPETARLLGVDITDPVQNLNGGARYLRMMYDQFGSWRLALAAYNAGPEAVQKYRGIPPFAETRTYVAAILSAR
jgi:soluble lytic murein transglycosylase-like protein